MTAEPPRGPILFDDEGRIVARPDVRPAEPSAAAPVPARPVLIDTDEPAGPIDHNWDEVARGPAAPRSRGLSSLSWFAIAATLLILGIGAVEGIGYVEAQFARAVWAGWATALIVGGAFGALGLGIWREVSGLWSVDAAERLQAALGPAAADPVASARAAGRWLGAVERRGVDVALSRAGLDRAGTVEAVGAALSSSVLLRLDREADAALRRAAMQIATAAALSPKAWLDGALFMWRGVRLVREIAEIYGLRPGILGTWTLLRRVMLGAATVAAADLAGGVAMQALVTSTLVQKLGGEVAGAAAAWQRMYRLGQAAIAACRPLPRTSDLPEA